MILTAWRDADVDGVDADGTVIVGGVTVAYSVGAEPVTLPPGTWYATRFLDELEAVESVVVDIADGAGVGGSNA